MPFVNINGRILPANKVAIPYTDRSFRFGDGLFETMKIVEGKIQLEQFHFDRLMNGLNLLKFEIGEFFLSEKFRSEIIQLCEKNNCLSLARVRLTISRGNGSLYEFGNNFNYLVEARVINESERLTEAISIGIFPDAKKSCDQFSNLKSANFLPYVMAAQFANENLLDDCLVLNVHGRICDSTISNVFWIRDNTIYTPPLTEGCIAGVMRKFLMEKTTVREQVCEIEDLENADEIFLTNAIRGIRPVKKFGDKIYPNEITNLLMEQFSKNLYYSSSL